MSDAQRVFGSEAPDQSYEAALRAADALFASPERGKAVPVVVAPPALDQPDSWSAETRPASAAGADAAGLPAKAGEQHATDAFGDGDDKGPAAHRRILQAIEPVGEDRFAALEAERAPKRRGRKPGSKNKPKLGVGLVDDWAARSTAPRVERAETSRPLRGFDESSLPPADVSPVGPDAVEADAGLSSVVEQPAVAVRVRNDRFGWKRDALRPGERWKRRLPKAAW